MGCSFLRFVFGSWRSSLFFFFSFGILRYHLSLIQQQKAGSRSTGNVIAETRQGVQVDSLPAPGFHT